MKSLAFASIFLLIFSGMSPAGDTNGDAKMQKFRARYSSEIKANGWKFVTTSNGPYSEEPISDWYVQSIKLRSDHIRSAWILEAYYEPNAGWDTSSSFQSEKAQWWVNCLEMSMQPRIWGRYHDVLGAGARYHSTLSPPDIDLPTSAPADFTELSPNSIGLSLVHAVCSERLEP